MRRGVSTVVGISMLLAITVVLSVTVGYFVVESSSILNQSTTPTIGHYQASYSLEDGYSGGVINIEHISGDSVEVQNIDIALSAECQDGRKDTRITDFPIEYNYGYFIDLNQVSGDDIVDRSYSQFTQANRGVLVKESGDSTPVLYQPGDNIILRIKESGCQMSVGDQTNIRIVHNPSDSVIIEKTLELQPN